MKYGLRRAFMFRAPRGVDLLEYIREFASKENIRAGLISMVGLLVNPSIGYYNIEKGVYEEIKLKGIYELLHGSGSISLRENKPFVHIHVALADKNGKAYGGHLIRGEVYIAEIIIIEFIEENQIKQENQ